MSESRSACHGDDVDSDYGPSTRAVHAGLRRPSRASPCSAGRCSPAVPPARSADASPYAYGRDANPSWTGLEHASASSRAASRRLRLRHGRRHGHADDADRPATCSSRPRRLPGVRLVASERLQPFGVRVRFVRTDTQAVVDAVRGARLVWLESPCNPKLEVVDIAAVAEAAHAPGRWWRSTTRSPRRSASARLRSAPTSR